jgi:DNA-binding transcriptional regulator YdaS (Cro superfamily)
MHPVPALAHINGTELARKLGVSKQLVSHWRRGRYRVSAEWCVEIERVTNGEITRLDLRPDLFGPVEAGQQ